MARVKITLKHGENQIMVDGVDLTRCVSGGGVSIEFAAGRKAMLNLTIPAEVLELVADADVQSLVKSTRKDEKAANVALGEITTAIDELKVAILG